MVASRITLKLPQDATSLDSVKRALLTACLVTASTGVLADWVPDKTIEEAATSWLSSDSGMA